MKHLWTRFQPQLFLVVLVAALFSTLSASVHVLSLKKQNAELLRHLRTFTVKNNEAPLMGHAGGLEGIVSQMAKAAHLKKLLSLGTSDSGGSLDRGSPDAQSSDRRSTDLRLDWESDQTSSLRFLSSLKDSGLVGKCLQLQISNSGDEPTLLRGRAVLETINPSPSTIVFSTTTFSGMLLARQVFTPLWIARAEAVPQVVSPPTPKQEEAKRREEARLEQERKEKEEKERLETKKHEMESNLMLTGIVNNGRESLAIINSKNSGETLMLRVGDNIYDARIVSVDEKKGEVRVDYSDKFQLSLRTNSR